jgi:hypothetical protein
MVVVFTSVVVSVAKREVVEVGRKGRESNWAA